MSQQITLADERDELTLDVNPEIPFFQACLSDKFAKSEKIYVSDLIPACSIVSYPRLSELIIKRIICENYFGIEPDLSILSKIDIHPNDYSLLLSLIDYFDQREDLVEIICKNLPEDYDPEIFDCYEGLSQKVKNYYTRDYLLIQAFKDDERLFHIIETDGKYVKNFLISKIFEMINLKLSYDYECFPVSLDTIIFVSMDNTSCYLINIDNWKIIESINMETYGNIYTDGMGIIHKKNTVWFHIKNHVILWNFDDHSMEEIEITSCDSFHGITNDLKFAIYSLYNKLYVFDIQKKNIHYVLDNEYLVRDLKISSNSSYFLIKYTSEKVILYEAISGKAIETWDMVTAFFYDDSQHILVKNPRLYTEKWDIKNLERIKMYDSFLYHNVIFLDKFIIHEMNSFVYSLDLNTCSQKLLFGNRLVGRSVKFTCVNPIIKF